MVAPKLAGTALSGALYLVVLQATSRFFTFFLNLAVARRVTPGVYGLTALSLTTLHTAVLGLSREGVRRAARRLDVASGGADALQQLTNLAWLGALISVPITVVGCAIFVFLAPPDVELRAEGVGGGTVEFVWAVAAFGGSALAEMATEPAYLLAENLLLFRIRVRVETVALVVRCTVTAALVIFASAKLSAFVVAQLAYGAAMCLGWLYVCRTELATTQIMQTASRGGRRPFSTMAAFLPRRYKPQRIAGAGQVSFQWLGPEALGFCRQYWLLEFGKVMLAEGEKIVLVGMGASATVQGEYGLVSNLGSLVVRLLFLPLEEVSTNLFARLAAAGDTRGLASMFTLLLKLLSSVGIVVIAFGPCYSFAAVHLLYSERWSLQTSAPRVLAWYCGYIFLLGVNGISEAFVQAVSSEREIQHLNVVLFVSTVGHICATLTTTSLGLGSVGIIIANCVAMALRACYALFFAQRYFASYPDAAPKGKVLAQAAPSFPICFALLLASASTAASGAYHGVLAPRFSIVRFTSIAQHVIVGIVTLGGVMAVALRTERKFIGEARVMLREARGGLDDHKD